MINIPRKINVGFQERKDTYTGKLGYVIYYDDKGKLCKEKSWNNWRNKSIPNQEFDNEPISGFVLIKRLVITEVIGIIAKHILEYMTLEGLNLKSQLRICYIF